MFPDLNSSWQPDLLSLAAGIVLGIAALTAARRIQPALAAALARLLARLQETKAWVRSGVEARYLAETAEYAQKMHLGRTWAALDEIFTEPRLLAPESEWDSEKNWTLGATQLHYLWPELARKAALPPPPSVSVRELLMNGQRVLILSEPGAGKTTLLAHCALSCARSTADGPDAYLFKNLPALVHAAELELEVNEDARPAAENDPLRPLAQALQRRAGPLTARGLPQLLKQAANGARLLLLLDGWDELAAGERPAFNNWLKDLLATYPGVRVIAAGYGAGYGPLLELEFVTTGILPWRSGAVESLGKRWSERIEFRGHVPITAFWRPGDTPFESQVRLQLILGEKLQGTKQSSLRFVELMELALRQALPSPMADGRPAWLPPAARDLWQHLAHEMLVTEAPALGQSRVAEVIEAVLDAYGIRGELRASHQLGEVIDQSPLLIRWPSGKVGFTSPLWRDYLAACYLAQMGQEEQVREQLSNPAWRGAVRYYVGRVGGSSLAESMGLGEPSQSEESLFQIAGWMAEAPDGGEWRRQAMLSLGRLVVDADRPTAMRQRAAIAMAETSENGVVIFLRQLLRQPDTALRQVALAALVRLAPETGVELVQRAWSDGDARIRWAAAHALAWTSDPSADQPLLTALLEPDEPIYRAAAEGFALNGTETAYEILREAAAEDALSVRRAAIFGMALLDHDWAAALLEETMRSESQWIIKSSATLALEAIAERRQLRPWQPLVPGNQSWLIDWALSQGRAVPEGPAAIPVLVEALRATDTRAREAAAHTLGQLAPRNVGDSLQLALADPAPEVRSASYEALWRIAQAWQQPGSSVKAAVLFVRDPAPATEVVAA